MNGMLASALTGLSVFIMGMLIIYFTPENDRTEKR
jgi:hypothetical protein